MYVIINLISVENMEVWLFPVDFKGFAIVSYSYGICI